MKRSLDYLTRYLSAFDRIKAELEPFTHCGPNYSRMAAEWFSRTRRKTWGIDGMGDVYHVVRGFAILRVIKGREQYLPKMEQTAKKFYDRIQAN